MVQRDINTGIAVFLHGSDIYHTQCSDIIFGKVLQGFISHVVPEAICIDLVSNNKVYSSAISLIRSGIAFDDKLCNGFEIF